jgi:hypothetical protein
MDKMVKVLIWCILMAYQPIDAQVHTYSVPEMPWNDNMGNHRAVLKVTKKSDAVFTKIYWRRRDIDPEKKRIIITDSKGNQVSNIHRININREYGDIVFEPISGVGTYYVYYMPSSGKKNSGWWDGKYLTPENKPDENWVQKTNPDKFQHLTHAEVSGIQSRTTFDSFYPMEVCATKMETEQLINRHKTNFILFPESRDFPIRMKADLPHRWIEKGPSVRFKGTAMRNEYYAFQVGLYAAKSDQKNINVSFSGSDKVTCFNTGGIDADGKSFVKKLDVPKGHVQALWFGVDIPENQKSGKMTFQIIISPENDKPQRISVELDVTNKVLADRGDSAPARHSRLRWLNSTLGMDDLPVAPYNELKKDDKKITYSMGSVSLTEIGLPATIVANNSTLLSSPVTFIIETDDGMEKIKPNTFVYTKLATGVISWKAQGSGQSISLSANGTMEFDGSVHYDLAVEALKNVSINDIRLEVPIVNENATYFMGMGLPGRTCPESYDWKWKGPQDSYWIGSVNAGLHVELQGADYTGPLLNLYHPAPPSAWFNQNKGGFKISKNASSTVTSTYSGERNLKSGDVINFQFRFLITPVKQLNTVDQFTNRYYHDGNKPTPSLSDLATGIKITNVHHANGINPYINYPFIAVDTMRQFINYWHEKGLKVKIYYTIRELTNQVPEIWALRSLGDEVLAGGSGGGFPWLREHFIDNYDVQWFNQINGYEECDASVRTSGKSRWYNYYINGLQWLVKNLDIDGLYLDDVSFDRNMMKRMRKVMNGVKLGCILDLHSNTGFSKGPANQYTEFFPFIDKIWFGESFEYAKMPEDNWIVEISGIPFGLMGDMLHKGGHGWRGMLYGMTVRYPWFTEGVSCDPREIWKIWDSFGIADAKMVGYWDNSCPVKVDHPDIKATAYIKKDKLLIAMASWAPDDAVASLKIDWKTLGIDPQKVTIKAPEISQYQVAKEWKVDEPIRIEKQKGWLIIIDSKL